MLQHVRRAASRCLEALERELLRLTGVRVPREAWQLDQLPDHLRVTYRVIDERSGRVAEDKDLDALKRRLAPKLRQDALAGGRRPGAHRPHHVERRDLPKVFEQGG
ncbi:hypothetical protein GCM10020219_086960 [Nonomuraea dietziae]